MSSFCLKAIWKTVIMCSINDCGEIKHVCWDIFLTYFFVLAVMCYLNRCHSSSKSIKKPSKIPFSIHLPFILTWTVMEYRFNSMKLLMICFSFMFDIDMQDRFYSKYLEVMTPSLSWLIMINTFKKCNIMAHQRFYSKSIHNEVWCPLEV